MNTPRITVDLDRHPHQRWEALRPCSAVAREFCQLYLKDLGGLGQFGSMVNAYRLAYVRRDHGQEIDALAEMCGLSSEEVLVANLYYDAIKVVLGCTAFAVDTPKGPLHARNLDWWTENNILRDYTTIMDFSRDGALLFQAVSWPGFIGVLSGLAPGRFAITLNAVSSHEQACLAQPVTLLLRQVFEQAGSYEEAVKMLATEKIVSDCLLLVTGTKQGQLAVIERTPTKGIVREPEGDLIAVTNHYRALGIDAGTEGELQTTSCGRYDRTIALIKELHPASPDAAFAILADTSIRMKITVQHMVMSASNGMLDVRLPTSG